MIPEIEFRYSMIYDELFRDDSEVKKFLKKNGLKYPSEEQIKKRMKNTESFWKKQENKILREIQKVSGLKWAEKRIICYIVGQCIPFSDPLTMMVFKEKEKFIDTLTHELIHQIQIQDNKDWETWWTYLIEKYPKESITTNSHILVYAIHKKIYSRMFNQRRLAEDISYTRRHSLGHYRAWQIVEKEGADNIIKQFHKITK